MTRQPAAALQPAADRRPVWSRGRLPITALALSGLVAAGALRLADRTPAAHAVLLGVLVVCGTPLVATTVLGIARRRFAADIVAAMAITGALLLGEYFAGAVIVLMQSGGEALENVAFRRASRALEALLSRAPRIGRRITPAGPVDVPVEELAVGEHVALRPGDMVPVDVRVLSGRSHVDHSAVTGEPMPVAAAAGSALPSGSINLEGALVARVEHLAPDSQYQQIVRLVEEARQSRAPVQRLADRWALWFTPLTLVMCLVTWWLSRDARSMLAVLVVATPCPFILATPVAVVAGIARAASRGIIVRGGAAIEAVGRVHIAVFDKTGTLTTGHPSVAQVQPAPGWEADEVLRLAGAAEQMSSHHIGQAIAGEARLRFADLPAATDFHESAGEGIEARVAGRQVRVGTSHWALGNGARPAGDGATRAHVAVNGRPAGAILLDDPVRAESRPLMDRLEHLGLTRRVMLTGDHPAAAGAVAQATGIAEVHAGLLPGDKARLIGELRRSQQAVLMVGDGINDAPALAAASVGIAMGAHAPAAAAEAADIVLLVDDVSRVGDAVAIGRRTRRIAVQSMGAGFAASFVLMIVAALGHIPPALGAVFQETIDVAVILNALRAR